eukprot:1138819-Pelagomonas_calceolata.AAC.4
MRARNGVPHAGSEDAARAEVAVCGQCGGIYSVACLWTLLTPDMPICMHHFDACSADAARAEVACVGSGGLSGGGFFRTLFARDMPNVCIILTQAVKTLRGLKWRVWAVVGSMVALHVVLVIVIIVLLSQQSAYISNIERSGEGIELMHNAATYSRAIESACRGGRAFTLQDDVPKFKASLLELIEQFEVVHEVCVCARDTYEFHKNNGSLWVFLRGYNIDRLQPEWINSQWPPVLVVPLLD